MCVCVCVCVCVEIKLVLLHQAWVVLVMSSISFFFLTFDLFVTEKDGLKPPVNLVHLSISSCISDNSCFTYFETVFTSLELYFPGKVFILLL